MAMIKLVYIYNGGTYNCNGSYATPKDIQASKGVRMIPAPNHKGDNLTMRKKQVLHNILCANILNYNYDGTQISNKGAVK